MTEVDAEGFAAHIQFWLICFRQFPVETNPVFSFYSLCHSLCAFWNDELFEFTAPAKEISDCATEALSIATGECKLYPIFEYEDNFMRSTSPELLSTQADLGCSIFIQDGAARMSGACMAVQCDLAAQLKLLSIDVGFCMFLCTWNDAFLVTWVDSSTGQACFHVQQ